MKTIIIVSLAIALLLIFMCIWIQSLSWGAQICYWKVLLAEGASEGEVGMRAIACVIRNRGGSLNGLYGAQRKDLDEFCERQGPHWIKVAKQIAREVFKENAPDITFGATHFENVERFDIPYWAKDMVITCTIKRHTFYREK